MISARVSTALHKVLAVAICALGIFAGFGCTKSAAPLAPAAARALPAAWDASCRDPLVNATQVWRLGETYFVEQAAPAPAGPSTTEPDFPIGGETTFGDDVRDVAFAGIDRSTERFLKRPQMRPAVQFGCVATPTYYEDALVLALKDGSPELKLQALAILLRVRSPSSVAQQWKCINELSNQKDRPSWQSLIAEWKACFDPRRLEQALKAAPTTNPYGRVDTLVVWSIRAAGAIRDPGALERLTVLSTRENIDTSLAAEKSIEDFDGPQANQALARCVAGWRYDAFERAGGALLRRDKSLLVKTLLKHEAPEQHRVYRGLLLARCDEPTAVPILCATVGRYQIIDREIFGHIARLGRAEHQGIIESLPAQVRPNQVEQAKHAVQEYQKRMGSGAEALEAR